ncbi:unnamed protein product, partial [Brenthis ino]
MNAQVPRRCCGVASSWCCTVRWRRSLPSPRVPAAPPLSLAKNHNAIARTADVERLTTTGITQPVYTQMRCNSHAIHHDGLVAAEKDFS